MGVAAGPGGAVVSATDAELVAAWQDVLGVAVGMPPGDRVLVRTALTMTVAEAEEAAGPPALVALLKAVVLLLAAADEFTAAEFREALDRGVPGQSTDGGTR